MVSISDLHYAYDVKGSVHGRKILQGIHMDINPGEITGILGPNGSGKSTMLKNIQLFLEPNQGDITYFSVSHKDIQAKELAKQISLVPQKSGGGQSLRVKEMILLGRIPHMKSRWSGFVPEDYERVNRVIEALHLQDFENRFCHCLSGGEFQKVLLARALSQESPVLLLDEATANLDMHHAMEIMELVQGLATAGTAVAAVLHDFNLAASFCHRLIVMHKGKVFREGTPQEVLTSEVIREVYGIHAYVGHDEMGVPFVLPRKHGTAGESRKSVAREMANQEMAV